MMRARIALLLAATAVAAGSRLSAQQMVRLHVRVADRGEQTAASPSRVTARQPDSVVTGLLAARDADTLFVGVFAAFATILRLQAKALGPAIAAHIAYNLTLASVFLRAA